MAVYDSIDLAFSWEGDYEIGITGDLSDTSEDALLSLKNEIRDIVKAEFGDWEKHPGLGAQLSDFQGEGNTRATGQNIQTRIRSKLIGSRIVAPEDLIIRVVPVNVHEVVVIITVSTVSTSANGLKPGEPVTITFSYDSTENSVFFAQSNDTERRFNAIGAG